jgi:hypothetical protein
VLSQAITVSPTQACNAASCYRNLRLLLLLWAEALPELLRDVQRWCHQHEASHELRLLYCQVQRLPAAKAAACTGDNNNTLSLV